MVSTTRCCNSLETGQDCLSAGVDAIRAGQTLVRVTVDDAGTQSFGIPDTTIDLVARAASIWFSHLVAFMTPVIASAWAGLL
jgi:hypothetical protein